MRIKLTNNILTNDSCVISVTLIKGISSTINEYKTVSTGNSPQVELVNTKIVFRELTNQDMKTTKSSTLCISH